MEQRHLDDLDRRTVQSEAAMDRHLDQDRASRQVLSTLMTRRSRVAEGVKDEPEVGEMDEDRDVDEGYYEEE